MPFSASIVNAGGNLPNDITQRINSFLAIVDRYIEQLARASGLRPSQIRLLRPCNIAYLVTTRTIFAVITNYNANGIAVRRYIDARQILVDLNTAIQQTEDAFGFEQCFGLEIPYNYIEAPDEQKERLAEEVANHYITEEILYLERLARIVRINPIFNGRDFLMDNSKVFVLAPFSEPFNTIYNDHIKTTVEAIARLRCYRADDIYDNRAIIEDIWRNINESRIVIAELTGKNPNVFYETGIAHTVGKEVILITQNVEDIPFDLRHLRCIIYDYTPPGVRTLETNLSNTIQTIIGR